jgi:glycosyltransferase involved in cell wall biosynthesis
VDVLKRYEGKIRHVQQANGGLASARNTGCRASRGDYIALMDADDLCMPERIAVQLAYLEQHDEAALCSSDFSVFDSTGPISPSFIDQYYSRVAETPGGICTLYPEQEVLECGDETFMVRTGAVYDLIALGNFIHPPTVMFRRRLFEECGDFDENIRNMCDYDWLVRASRFGRFGFIDRSLLDYRLSQQQMSGKKNRVQVTLDIVRVMEKTCTDDPALFRRHEREFRKRLGDGYLSAADALADAQPWAAIAMLVRSALQGVVRDTSFKALIKCLLPQTILKMRRGQK